MFVRLLILWAVCVRDARNRNSFPCIFNFRITTTLPTIEIYQKRPFVLLPYIFLEPAASSFGCPFNIPMTLLPNPSAWVPSDGPLERFAPVLVAGSSFFLTALVFFLVSACIRSERVCFLLGLSLDNRPGLRSGCLTRSVRDLTLLSFLFLFVPNETILPKYVKSRRCALHGYLSL